MKGILNKLYLYQKERFPLIFLLFTTLSTILCLILLTESQIRFDDLISVYFCALVFLFHFRVIDEIRDYSHDKKYYPERPISRGLISINQLLITDIVLLSILLIITILYSIQLFAISLIFIAFSLIALKNFGFKNYFQNKLILYHLINSPSMIIIFLFILFFLLGSFTFSTNLILYLFLYYSNIFLLEVGRKSYIDNDKIKFNDTYSSSLGLNILFIFLLFLLFLSYALFIIIILSLNNISLIALLLSILLFIFSLITIIFNRFASTKKINKLMQLSFFTFFVGLNLLIYFA